MDFSKILSWAITCLVIVAFISREISLCHDEDDKENWILVSNKNTNTVFNSHNITKVAYDESMSVITDKHKAEIKNVTTLEFYAQDVVIQNSAFSGCKQLKEVVFYNNPKFIAESAFKGCNNLSLIKLIGNQEDFTGFSITVPKNCEIQFIPLKQVQILGGASEKSPLIQADVYVHNAGTEQKNEITENITNTTNNDTHIETDIDSSENCNINATIDETDK